jgi:hypothetical protein
VPLHAGSGFWKQTVFTLHGSGGHPFGGIGEFDEPLLLSSPPQARIVMVTPIATAKAKRTS